MPVVFGIVDVGAVVGRAAGLLASGGTLALGLGPSALTESGVAVAVKVTVGAADDAAIEDGAEAAPGAGGALR